MITSWEKYGGIAASKPSTAPAVSFGAFAPAVPWLPNRSGSENAGHSRARPQPRVSL